MTPACTLDEFGGAPRITTVALTFRARVPGLDRAGLRRYGGRGGVDLGGGRVVGQAEPHRAAGAAGDLAPRSLARGLPKWSARYGRMASSTSAPIGVVAL